MSKDDKHDVETTGHSWDGIEEYNNPLPKWWLYVFYATIIWGIAYSIAYPAWPGIKSATAGVLGWSTRANIAQELSEAEAANAEIRAQLVSADLATLPENAEILSFANNAGAAVFRTHCSQCHGSGAAGATGYPNLLDDAWLWGGTLEDIHITVTHGIRNEQSPDARWSQMPAFGDLLAEEEIDQVVNYVMSLSGEPKDSTLVSAGEALYLDNCSACHGENAEGDIYQGAPNLSDAIWLYGGDYDSVKYTVQNARFGVMPAWSEEYRPAGGLDEAEIRAVAVYVHGLGGGE